MRLGIFPIILTGYLALAGSVFAMETPMAFADCIAAFPAGKLLPGEDYINNWLDGLMEAKCPAVEGKQRFCKAMIEPMRSQSELYKVKLANAGIAYNENLTVELTPDEKRLWCESFDETRRKFDF